MCGIAGISRAETSSIPDARVFARELAYAIEDRGGHATGFGWEHKGWPYFWKQQGPASIVAPSAPLSLGMRTVIVHTRYATKGSPKVEANNHPVTAPGIVLVHNGRVENDDELIAAVGHQREGAVDSEAIAALMSYGPEALGGNPAELMSLVRGVAAVAWIDGSEPGVLHLARAADRPLSFGHTRKGDLVFGSTPIAITRAAAGAGVLVSNLRTVGEGTYLRVEAGEVVDVKRFQPCRSAARIGADVPTSSRKPRRTSRRNLATVRETERVRADDLPLSTDYQQTIDGIDWNNLVPRRGWSS